jgi:hypothetical protein
LFLFAAHLFNSLGLPVGCLVRPFINNNTNNLKKNEYDVSKDISEIARCNECGSYINGYCDINTLRWFCSICNRKNSYNRSYVRYRHVDAKIVPELKYSLVDLNVPLK